ncbi:MAG: hypothetical protein LM590_16095 [Thermofilum sp.]|jgi:hypothetical protein|nr:hypothetical protein [Thermofilum sp.]
MGSDAARGLVLLAVLLIAFAAERGWALWRRGGKRALLLKLYTSLHWERAR